MATGIHTRVLSKKSPGLTRVTKGIESLDFESDIMVHDRSLDDRFWGETIGFAGFATELMTLLVRGPNKVSFAKKASWSPGLNWSFGPPEDT